MDSNTIKYGQLASLTAFTGQSQATEQLAAAAIQNEVQVTSLKGLSLGVEAAYEPHQLKQGTHKPMEQARDQYRRYREAEYVKDYYGVDSQDRQNLLEYKTRVDEQVEMQYLPASVKVDRIK